MLSFLRGRKTYISAAIAALVAVNAVLDIVPPYYEQNLLAVAAALGLYGLRSAIADAKNPPAQSTPDPSQRKSA